MAERCRKTLALLACACIAPTLAHTVGGPSRHSLRRGAVGMKQTAAGPAAASAEVQAPAKAKRPRLPRSRTAQRRVSLQTLHLPLDRSSFEGASADSALDAVVEGVATPSQQAAVFSRLSSSSYPALVLNADYRPLSYLPLSLMSWQDSIKAICRDSVQVVATYDRSVRSPSVEILLPSVIVLKRYSAINAGKEASLTRRNLFLRDGFQCQYCGDCLPAAKLTYDHVHPRSLGGKTSWTNTVTACGPCNNKKGSKLLRELPSMKLRHEPRAPQWHALQAGSKAYPPKKMHPSWHDYFF